MGRQELEFRVGLYLPDRLAAICELKRVVKPGGRVCLTIPTSIARPS